MIETLGVIGGQPFEEYEIFKSGLLYYLVKKGTCESVNGEYYDTPNTAYFESCKYLRTLNIRFMLFVPNYIFEQ